MISLQQQSGAPGSENTRHLERRILHPVRRREDWPRTAPDSESIRRICVIDCETTGLDVERHQVIEICAAMVMVSNSGQIRGIQSIGTGLVNPGHPLDPAIVELTGLTDADLTHTTLDHDRLTEFIHHCEGVVAFNSGYDRPFVEKLLPALRPLPWGCAWQDVPWRRLGFEPGPQGYLLTQAGRFMSSAHRAQDDVLALIDLLDHVGSDGESVMAKTLAAMDGDAWRFEAKGAPFGDRSHLRERRYRWAAAKTHRVWHKHVRPPAFEEELDWYRQTIGQQPAIVPLPATERYRADRTWKPA